MGWLLQEGWKLLIAGGGGAVITYEAFKRSSERWLDAKFAERLEKLKHAQQKEIEGIRQQVQWHFSRVSKIHDKEFEILPKAWFLLHEANGRAGKLVDRLKQIPDFLSIPHPKLQEFLKTSRLSESDQQRLLEAPRLERHQIYTDAIDWAALSDAEKAQIILNNYLIENRIFMTTELADAFRSVSTGLASVNSDYQCYKQYKVPDLLTKSADRFALLPPQIQEIEAMIQERLHYEKA